MVIPWGSRTVGFKVTMTVAFMGSPVLTKNPLKNSIDVCQKPAGVEDSVDIVRGQRLFDIRIAEDFVFEGTTFIPDTHGVSLDPAIGVFTGDARRNQSQQQLSRVNQAVRQF